MTVTKVISANPGTVYSIGDRVGRRYTDQQQGTVIAKTRGVIRVRWDNGVETSGGFCGCNLFHLRKNPLEVYNANRR